MRRPRTSAIAATNAALRGFFGMSDDLDTRDDKPSRPLDRTSHGVTLLYSLGLGLLGIAIIAIGIVGAFHH